ncbi:MAG: hypothetical protein ACE14P_10760 [Methanotrichaceae archaeon]
MHNKLIFLAVLALMIVGTALCELSEVTKIPASQDVDIYFGDRENVYNADSLMCEINVTDINGSRKTNYFGAPMIQFNASGIKITEDDIGILVLKTASIKKQGNEPAFIAMMPIQSNWNENSSYQSLYFRLEPAVDIVERNDITGMRLSTDGDKIVAFDVSKELLDANADGGFISFLLMAVSDSSYSVDFKSRETGEGPYLIVMPYPSEVKANSAILLPANSSEINQSAINQSAINQTSSQAVAQMKMVDALKENAEKTAASGNSG